MLPLMSLEAAGTEYGADNPEVMGKIVRSRMLPIAMTAPHDTGTLLFSDSPEYADKDGILYVDKVKAIRGCIFTMSIRRTIPAR